MYQPLQSHPSRSTEKRSSLFHLPQLFFRFVFDITYSQFLVYLHQIFGERENQTELFIFSIIFIFLTCQKIQISMALGESWELVSVWL